MAVSPYPRDVDGTNLQTKVTAAQTVFNSINASSPSAKAAAAAALDQAQRELVDHYMARGRLTAANILATMT